MRRIILIGNVCNEPTMQSTPSGVTVCTFSVAVDRKYKDSNGDKVTDFFRVQAWRQLGEVCNRHVKKDMKVGAIGELKARTYEAKDGSTRIGLDVTADEVDFMSYVDEKPKPAKKPADPYAFEDISTENLPWE